MIKVAPLVWSETKPLKLNSNQHDCCCEAHTPFGRILITWKEEEANQSARALLLFERYDFHDFPIEHDGVEKAKEACELEYRRRILSALIEEEPQFTKEEVEMHSAPWSYLNPPSDDESLADEDLLSLEDLRDAWNTGADRFNSWDELGLDEIIAFAQCEAVNKWRKMNKSKAEKNDSVINNLLSKLKEANAIALEMFDNVRKHGEPISHEEAMRIFRHLRPIRSAINAAAYYSP